MVIVGGMVAVVLVGIVATSTRSASTQTFSEIQAAATKLSEEQMERVLAFRDQQGITVLPCGTNGSIQSNTPPLAIGPTVSVNSMNVWFTVSCPGACPTAAAGIIQFKQVTTFAQWTDSKGMHQSQQTKCFAEWR